MRPNPLDLVSTKELIDTLCDRFTHAVFAGIIDRPIGEDVEVIRVTRISGCRYIGQALASSLAIKAHEENQSRAVPASDEDL